MSKWPYNTAIWRRLRWMKLKQNTLCEICLKHQRLQPAVAVDHILAIASGGDPFPPLDRLMSLCVSCHNRKTRIVEQQGQQLTPKGCDARGMPLNPDHPWFKGG